MLSMNAAFLTLCLSHAASAVHLNLYKRADAVTPPATINIPLFFDSNGRYIVPVGMVSDLPRRHEPLTDVNFSQLDQMSSISISP